MQRADSNHVHVGDVYAGTVVKNASLRCHRGRGAVLVEMEVAMASLLW